MGRLDNIIARNQRRARPSERLVVSFVLGLIVLLIIALAVFTDLGVPPGAGPAVRAPRDAPATPERGKRIDGVLLRPAPPAPAAPPR